MSPATHKDHFPYIETHIQKAWTPAESPLCMSVRQQVGFRRREMSKSMKCDIEKTSERWCDLAGSLLLGGMLRCCITLRPPPKHTHTFLFLYHPLLSFAPARYSSPVCAAVFAMNTFRESPLLWSMIDEDWLHSSIMLSPWPTLTARCLSIFCILMGFERPCFSSWQVNAHPNRGEDVRTFS